MIDRRDIRTLVTIAEDAGVRQIADTRGAAVLAANDVIDLVRKTGAVLMQQAVFASSTGSLYDKKARRRIDITSH